MVTKKDYDLAERENGNLRAALAWAAARLPDDMKNELELRLDAAIDDGGVTGTSAEEDLRDAVALLGKFLTHTEGLMSVSRIVREDGSRYQRSWFARLDSLLNEARGYEPKHPLMQRIGGSPNVFAPVRSLRRHQEAIIDQITKELES